MKLRFELVCLVPYLDLKVILSTLHILFLFGDRVLEGAESWGWWLSALLTLLLLLKSFQ